MRDHIYVLLLSAAIIGCAVPHQALADLDASTSPDEAAGLFGITPSLEYPAFPDGSSHSALRPGDSFRISLSSYDLLLHDVSVDASAVGLPASLPLAGSFGRFASEPLTIPAGTPDGTYTLTVHARSAFGAELSANIAVVLDSVPPRGRLEASIGTTSDPLPRYVAHLAGTYDGTGSEAVIIGGRVFSADAGDEEDASVPLDTRSFASASSPFTTSLLLPILNPTWSRIGISLSIIDEAGNTADFRSAPFPLPSSSGVLINHARGGTVVEASNYEPGDIPAGIGIPHTLINSLPLGDYYAVVFFAELPGCPTANYEINAFRAGAYWGYGVLGSSGLYSHAWSSHGGGCMQQFRVDPTRKDDWL